MRLSNTINPAVSYITIGAAICVFFFIVYTAHQSINKLETIISVDQVTLDD